MSRTKWGWWDTEGDGLQHPHLVVLDLSTLSWYERYKPCVRHSTPILKSRRIGSFADFFTRKGQIRTCKIGIPKGYEFIWHDRRMELNGDYALFVALAKRGTGGE